MNFRHLLEAYELSKTVFEAVAEYLETPEALLRGGTIVDATLNRRLAVHQERGGQALSADAGSPLAPDSLARKWTIMHAYARASLEFHGR